MKMSLDEACVVLRHLGALGYPSSEDRELMKLAQKIIEQTIENVRERYRAEKRSDQ